MSAYILCILLIMQNVFPLNTVEAASFKLLIPDDGITDEPLLPLPAALKLDEQKVALGRKLFYEPRLSTNNTVACVSCHDLARGGVDGLEVSIGVDGARGRINAPTVFNSIFNLAFFWDGRAATLQEQIDGPVTSPIKMGSSWPQVIGKLKRDHGYSSVFKQLYTAGITPYTVKDAIATFIRSLTTPNSRFDQFLRGNENAINDQEKHGYQLFKLNGCTSCHQGRNIGGNMYQVIGVMEDYIQNHVDPNGAHLGRFNVTGRKEDRYKFRVPSLRNIALTAPYFHDGRARKLEDAVKKMAKYQLGRPISDEDVALIVRFLKTLTGEYQGHPL